MGCFFRYFTFFIFLCLHLISSSLVSYADYLSAGKLYWAATPSSGVPSVFYAQDDPTRLQGYNVEIIEAIGKKIGRDPKLIQNEWEGLALGLINEKYDIVLNDLVINEQRKEKIDFSIPYYVGYYQLVVNSEISGVKTLEDCKDLRVGAVKAYDAARVLKESNVRDIRIYVEDLSLFQDLANKRIDALLIDAPIALYYAKVVGNCKLVGAPIGEFAYAIGVKKGNAILGELNRALAEMMSDGTLKAILIRWNLWNEQVARSLGLDFSQLDAQEEPTAYNEFLTTLEQKDKNFYEAYVKEYVNLLPLLGSGALMTLEISTLAMVLAIMLGLVLAVVRIYGPKYLSILAKCYIESVRGTPLLIQLYFIFYGLPSVGIKLEPFVAGVIALGLNYAACEAENYRAGILSVPKGQMEAARALGMTHLQGLRYVVLPQAFRVVLPPITNDFISLLKDSSLVSVITIIDLTFAYNMLATTYYNFFGIGIVVAIFYFLLGFPFVQFARWAEKRLTVERRRRPSCKGLKLVD